MEEKRPALSVIIPLYNSEGFLSECLDSILKTEGSEELEIMIVNDGSTDGSLKVAKDLENAHDNITVYDRPHGGVSDARNYGLERAKGDYVFFCDADDKVVPSSFSEVIRTLRKDDPDVIIWDGAMIREDGTPSDEKNVFCVHRGITSKDVPVSGKKILEEQLMSCRDHPTVIWLGAYKRSFLTEHGLLFRSGIRHEDDLWVPMVLMKAGKVRYIPSEVYLYRVRPSSLSRPSGQDVKSYIESILYIYPFLYRYVRDNESDVRFMKLMEGNLTRKYLYWIFRYGIHKTGYGKNIDASLLWKTSNRIRDKIRVIILIIRRKFARYG